MEVVAADIQTGEDTRIYRCERLTATEEAGVKLPWDRISPIQLVDTVTGQSVREPTEVRACWSSSAWYVQFRCTDHYVVSVFEKRDDPLYEQDVVEVFIDEEGDGHRYLEVELSPYNVVFDARIKREKDGAVCADVSWDMELLETRVFIESSAMRVYEFRFPLETFTRKPQVGMEWRVNFYRIDEQPEGTREYQAWGPTREVNYHLPSRFGRLLFV